MERRGGVPPEGEPEEEDSGWAAGQYGDLGDNGEILAEINSLLSMEDDKPVSAYKLKTKELLGRLLLRLEEERDYQQCHEEQLETLNSEAAMQKEQADEAICELLHRTSDLEHLLKRMQKEIILLKAAERFKHEESKIHKKLVKAEAKLAKVKKQRELEMYAFGATAERLGEKFKALEAKLAAAEGELRTLRPT